MLCLKFQEAIALAPEAMRGYLCAGRALLKLGRASEAAQALELASEIVPASTVAREALEEARYVVRGLEKEAAQLKGSSPGRDTFGIRRGACRSKGCECKCYVQKQSSHAVRLNGRYVRHDNDETLLRCVRCGHASYLHADTRPDAPHDARRANANGTAARAAECAVAVGGGLKSVCVEIPADEPKAVPHTPTGARGGLNSRYYYSAVPREQRKVPEPQRIHVASATAGGFSGDRRQGGSTSGEPPEVSTDGAKCFRHTGYLKHHDTCISVS